MPGMFARILSTGSAVFVAGVALVNGAHPILHVFEEGSLDAVLGYLNALAAQVASSRSS